MEKQITILPQTGHSKQHGLTYGKFTHWDHSHPHMQMKKHLQDAKIYFRTQSNEMLDKLVEVERGGEKWSAPRHQKIAFLLECTLIRFKKEFEDINGFPFEDIYDKEKMKAHRTAYIAKQEEELKKASEVVAEDKPLTEEEVAARAAKDAAESEKEWDETRKAMD